ESTPEPLPEAAASEPPPAPVAAPEPPAPPEPPPPPAPWTFEGAADTSLAERREPPSEGPPRFDLVRINVGPKIGYVTHGGYDAFSTNDVLPAFSIDGTVPLLTRGRLVLAAGLAWEPGVTSADTRGIRMSLTSHRFGIPI